MPIFTLDPFKDSRWSEFLSANPRASVFHSVPWLDALRRTYGYEPVVYTTTPPGEPLRDGIVFGRVESWITGRRLVSLPFSDHCDSLVEDSDPANELFATLRQDCVRQRWRYVELRPLAPFDGEALRLKSFESYCFHELDLAPSLDALFHGLHKDCVQRKIKRAAREKLVCVEGRSETLLRDFYRLLLLTRRRHQVPPQPLLWYRNLIDCLGESLKISVAYKNEVPVASILTLQYKEKLVFKFGCSDPVGHQIGGVQFLLWNSIQKAKESGLLSLDLGRSETTNSGLITFKDRWGASRSDLTYWKYSTPDSSPALFDISRTSVPVRIAKRIFGHAPSFLLSAAGNLFYRHIG